MKIEYSMPPLCDDCQKDSYDYFWKKDHEDWSSDTVKALCKSCFKKRCKEEKSE